MLKNNETTVMITGGAGFVGSHLAEHLIRKTTWNIIIIDKLSYASFGLKRLQSSGILFSDRLKYYIWDLTIPFSFGLKKELEDVSIIFHLASQTHVDNSISDPVHTIKNNVLSTVYLLEYARTLKNLQLFHYMGTDESYGVAELGKSFKETDAHTPTNPYSASKSSSENIVMAYGNTYKIPWLITNAMNIFGQRQHVEKFIPKVIKSILNDEKVYIHSYPDCKKAGSRGYIHARNISDALLFLVKNNIKNTKYNIPAQQEMDNLEIALFISNIIGKPLKYEMVNFHEDRPGHDLRYSLDGTKLYELGWTSPVSFTESLKDTIKWTLENKIWLEEDW